MCVSLHVLTPRKGCLQPPGVGGAPTRHQLCWHLMETSVVCDVRQRSRSRGLQTLLPEPIPKTRERLEGVGDAKRKMLCVRRLRVEMQTGKSTPAGPQAGMKNEALYEGENMTLVTKWQRTWLNRVQTLVERRTYEPHNSTLGG